MCYNKDMLVMEKRQTKRRFFDTYPPGYIYYYTNNSVFLAAINIPDGLVLRSKVALTKNSTVLFNLSINFFKTIKLVGKICTCSPEDLNSFLLTVHIEYIKLSDLQKLKKRLARYESLAKENKTQNIHKAKQLVCGTLVSCSTWEVQIKDLGLKGIRIAAAEKITISSQLQLMFLLPTMEYVVMYGKVIWGKELPDLNYEHGIQFTKIDNSARTKIKEYLQAL
jgi:hypothetical protein